MLRAVRKLGDSKSMKIGPLESSGRTFVTTPTGTTAVIPEGWVGRTADNGKGIVYQRPGAIGDADSIRVMQPNARNPNGYVVYYNRHGQPLNVDGNITSPLHWHIPLTHQGPLPKWPQ